MFNSTFKTKPDAKGLKRSGFKPRAGPGIKRSKPMKASRPKTTKARQAAKMQDCTLQFMGVCNRNPETVVLCHSNLMEDGKGMGLKASDTKAAFGCCACHDVLDGRAPRPAWMSYLDMLGLFAKAVDVTQAKLQTMGVFENNQTK